MRALVVYESIFGNGADIAAEVGTGLASRLEVEVVAADAAPTTLDGGIALLVVGGPNHRFALSTPDSRSEAVGMSSRLVAPDRGLREWLADLDPGPATTLAAVYDTRLTTPPFLRWFDHASGMVERALRHKRLGLLVPSAHFLVSAATGPLVDGELARARVWGEDLAARLPAPARRR